MDWLKKHVDTIVILSAFGSSVIWINGKFNDIEKQFSAVEREFSEIRQELAVIKTVLIMNKMMPIELARLEEKIKDQTKID